MKLAASPDGGSDTSHDAAFGEPLTDVRHGAHDLLHATDGIRGLGVAHLVEHRGEFSRGVRCGAADGSDSSGDILDPVRTLEFGQTLLESLEDIFPLVGTALLARLEQLVERLAQLIQLRRTLLDILQLCSGDEGDALRRPLAVQICPQLLRLCDQLAQLVERQRRVIAEELLEESVVFGDARSLGVVHRADALLDLLTRNGDGPVDLLRIGLRALLFKRGDILVALTPDLRTLCLEIPVFRKKARQIGQLPVLRIFGDLERAADTRIGGSIALRVLFERVVLLLQQMQCLARRTVRIDIDGDHQTQRIGFQNVLGAVQRLVDIRIQFLFRKDIAVGENRRDENLVALAGRVIDAELGTEHRSYALAGILPPLLRQTRRVDHRPSQQIDIADETIRHLLSQRCQTLVAQMASQRGDGLVVLALGILALRSVILVGFE